MKRTVQLVALCLCTFAATGAFAFPPPDPPDPPEDDGGGDDGGEDEPPPPQSVLRTVQRTGAIGGSTLGADYQAALQVWVDGPRQNLLARGYASAHATLLGNRQNLVILNANVTAGDTFRTEVSTYVLGAQIFAYEDTYTASFSKTFSLIDWRNTLWSYERSWSFLGASVRLRLAVDGGTTLAGSAAAGPLHASGQLEPRVWVDAGGALSAHLLWWEVGSLHGMVHLVDATGSGSASIDARPLLDGQPITWAASGMARLCSGGGRIWGCLVGRCGDLASWENFCPGWLTLSGSTGGTI